MADAVIGGAGVSKCASCATELAPTALACPSCTTLVYRDLLKELAASAERLTAAKDLAGAREKWVRALALLPEGTQQHASIRDHISALDATIVKLATPQAKPTDPNAPRWKRVGGGVIAAGIFALGKLKFLLLGLTKASTFFSMFAFFGVYWTAFGWPLALGLVLSIYIHEMGHVAAIRRFGINASAPLFIPGLGALVRLRQHVSDPVTDARIGLAGPIWGLGAGITAWIVGLTTGSHMWLAIAQLTAYINLFNLIPVWQLDGSRGFHALDRTARWLIVAGAVAMFIVTSQRMLLLIAAVGAYRAFQPTSERPDRRALVEFLVLLAALGSLAAVHVTT